MQQFTLAKRSSPLLALPCLLLLVVLSGCHWHDDEPTGTVASTSASGSDASTATSGTAAAVNGAALAPAAASAATPSTGSTASTASISVGTGTINLAWQPPTESSDGTQASGLSGYRILYGTSSMDYTSSIQVASASTTNYIVQNLAAGTYYITVATYDSSGTESALSPEVTVTVD